MFLFFAQQLLVFAKILSQHWVLRQKRQFHKPKIGILSLEKQTIRQPCKRRKNGGKKVTSAVIH
jgi:hypothetical protein